LLGLDPDKAEEIVKSKSKENFVTRPAADRFPVQPQRELEELRKRVNEQARRLAGILLNHVELDINGREIPYKYTSLNISARTNFVAAVMMVNHEIQARLKKERKECSAEELKDILGSLDDILQILARRIRKAKSVYEQQT